MLSILGPFSPATNVLPRLRYSSHVSSHLGGHDTIEAPLGSTASDLGVPSSNEDHKSTSLEVGVSLEASTSVREPVKDHSKGARGKAGEPEHELASQKLRLKLVLIPPPEVGMVAFQSLVRRVLVQCSFKRVKVGQGLERMRGVAIASTWGACIAIAGN